jgi:hypothetical protein
MNRTPIAWLMAAASLVASPAAAAQEPAVVTGRVLEAGTDRPLESVDVRLAGAVRVTDADGRFSFEGVPPGRHTLALSALGYRSQEVVLDVVGDTTLTIRLEVGPVPLDPVDVRSRFVDVRGRVRDAARDMSLRDAEVVAGAERTTTGVGGRFRVRRVPAGEPVVVQVRAFGYLPASVQLAPENDTTLDFELEEDPVTNRMIEQLVETIEIRSRALPYARRHIGRDELLRRRNFPVSDLLRFTFGPRIRRVQCVMIDDMQVPFGLEQLASYMAEELQYIEVIDGGGMIRLYTRRYVSRRLGPDVKLPPVLFVKTPTRPFCQ